MTCTLPHTKFQPLASQWYCPNCEAMAEFYVDRYKGPTAEADMAADCELLHVHDIIVCDSCNREWTGTQLAAAMAKKFAMTKCPYCDGTGLIKKEDI